MGMAERLAALVAIDVGFFAILSNHMHFILRTRPDVAATWSDEEVVRRYKCVQLLVKSVDGRSYEPPNALEIALAARDKDDVERMRNLLSHPSLFMGGLCEHVAVRANREDERHGCFWEGRYKCRRLESTAAVLVCALYVDLNPIRAGEASTPEGSVWTSARLRLAALQAGRPGDADGWLCELFLDERTAAYEGVPSPSSSGRRASDKGILPLSTERYLELVDWAGRIPKEGQGAVPAELAPLLERAGLARPEGLQAVDNFDARFGRVVGAGAALAQRAAEAGRRCYRGVVECRKAFG